MFRAEIIPVEPDADNTAVGMFQAIMVVRRQACVSLMEINSPYLLYAKLAYEVCYGSDHSRLRL